MEHLALEVFDHEGTGSQYAVLEPDATITITDTSEIFADGDVWSYDFTLNVHTNAHLFGTAGDIHGSRLHEQIDKRKARLWAEGVPLYLGYLKLGDEAEVDAEGNVDVTFESGQKTFKDKIEGAKANQVPMIGNVKIGVALWQKRQVSYTLGLRASAIFENKKESEDGEVKESLNDTDRITFVSDDEQSPTQQYPRMVFPVGTFKDWSDFKDTTYPVNELNTESPYSENENGVPTHPFCNIALCYQRQGYQKENEKGELIPDYTSEPEAQRGYEYMPAKRVNSAPNFFVLYWIRALMNHLGIYIEENQMLNVEDLRRLFFVNTNCAYKVPKRKFYTGDSISWYQFLPSTGRLVPEYYNIEEKSIKEKSAFKSVEDGFIASTPTIDPPAAAPFIPQSLIPTIDHIIVKINEVDTDKQEYENNNRWLHDAYATSDCFPNADISEVINAIESGFGVRMLFSNDYKRVRIVLLRNVFRSEEVQDITCEIVDEDVKVENSIRGFRMTYGNTEDTHFYYKGFADMLPHKKELWADTSDEHDYSHWDLNAIYSNIIHKVSAFDKTCYVTPNTGNAYGIKIDKDAKRYDELHPSLFGFADFMDAEDGDCAGEEETIMTVNAGFAPAIMNDLNFEQERDGKTDKPRYALFVDETMRPRRPELIEGTDYNDPETVYPMDGEYGLYGDKSKAKDMKAADGIVKPGEFAVRSDMYAGASGLKTTVRYFLKYVDMFFHDGPDSVPVYAQWDITNLNIDGHINEGYRLYLQDNYEPNDNGISPIETHDWGLTLGIMRGSGSDAYVNYSDDPDDGEGNQTWDIVPGSSVTAHPDTCDSYGNEWDYNGTQDGIGSGGRVSLKLRTEKPNPYFNPNQEENNTTNRRYLEITNPNLRQRGLADQFYKEYSYWIRNARIVKRTVRMTLAQLLTIDKTKRVCVGDVTGFIRKMQYSVSNETGLGNVTMEIMYI